MPDHACLECGSRLSLSVEDAGWFCAKCGTWWDDYMISVMHKVDARARADERKRLREQVAALEVREPWGPTGAQMIDRAQVLRILAQGGEPDE